jgi:hypothetical protein
VFDEGRWTGAVLRLFTPRDEDEPTTAINSSWRGLALRVRAARLGGATRTHTV